MKQILQMIIYKGIYVIAYTVSLIPMVFLYAMASFAFFLIYNIIGYRKAVVIQNMARSFPDKSYEEIHCIMKIFYMCFTAYFAEIIKSISIPAKELDKKIIFENLELIDRYINTGRNVIVCLGHCANWEMPNFIASKLPYNMYAVYKPLRSITINRLMVKIRSRFGVKLISHKSIVRHILTQKSSPAVYFFLADQCPRIKDDKYKFEFLNQETYVFSGMEKLSRISRSSVIYLQIKQLSKGSYKVTCIPICSQTESMNEGEISLRYINLLAENINQEPYGWLWTHKRWKK